MSESYEILLALGCILLLGLYADTLGKRLKLPRVTLLILFGVGLGVNGFDVIPEALIDSYEIIADTALVMIGFLVGGKLSKNELAKSGYHAVLLTLVIVFSTIVIVSVGLHLAGMSWSIALILGCIASATAPAATLDVILESGKSTKFVDRLVTVVALDDLIALMIFSLLLSIFINSADLDIHGHNAVFESLKEISGATLLGIIIGYPASILTGKAKPGSPLLIEALGLIMICGGLAKYFEVSYLIAAITMGVIVTNFAKHHEYAFYEIEGIEKPFMMLFFILAGASTPLQIEYPLIVIIIIYVCLRITGKAMGGYVGGCIVGMTPVARKWTGLALLPQAGVALGMMLVAANYMSGYHAQILNIVIISTIIFEIIGPVFTYKAIQKVSAI